MIYHPQDLLGQSISAIDTPALVVDLDAMERNLATMAAFASQHKVRLRPHAKMHKSAVLAKLQIALGIMFKTLPQSLRLRHTTCGDCWHETNRPWP